VCLKYSGGGGESFWGGGVGGSKMRTSLESVCVGGGASTYNARWSVATSCTASRAVKRAAGVAWDRGPVQGDCGVPAFTTLCFLDWVVGATSSVVPSRVCPSAVL
jgi:hypothetical protein